MATLHLISDNSRRGAQVFAADLVHTLESRGIDGSVAALTQGATGARLDVPVLGSSWRSRRKVLAEYELVVAHGSTTLDAASLLAPRRFVYRSIGDPSFWLRRPTRLAKTVLQLHLARAVVALYPQARAFLERTVRPGSTRVETIPAAVLGDRTAEPARPADLPTGSRHVLFVGSLSWEKQVHHLVEAMAALTDVGLVVVGEGPEGTAVRELATELLGPRVLFTGAVEDPWPYYHACDVLALTSKTEGVPGCMLEASLAGMPTVAYGVGGIRSVIKDGWNGVLVRPDDRTQLTAKLRSTLEGNPVEFGARARQTVLAEHTMDRVASQWQDLIDEITIG